MSRGRIRTVKPEWRLDQRMLRSGHEARIFSVVLLTLADDEGRGRWIELKMAAEGFAEDPDPVASVRAAVKGLTPWYFHIYKIDGEGYFQILKFVKHQYIEKPHASSIPACPDLEFVPKNGRELPHWRFRSNTTAIVPSSSPTPPLHRERDSAGLSLSTSYDPHPHPDPEEAMAEGAGGEPAERVPGARSLVGNRLRHELEKVGLARREAPKTLAKAVLAVEHFLATNPGRRSDEVIVSAMAGFKANRKAADAGWPLSFFAQNLLEYVDKAPRGPVSREELEANGGTKTMTWGDVTGAPKDERRRSDDDEVDDG